MLQIMHVKHVTLLKMLRMHLIMMKLNRWLVKLMIMLIRQKVAPMMLQHIFRIAKISNHLNN